MVGKAVYQTVVKSDLTKIFLPIRLNPFHKSGNIAATKTGYATEIIK
jgi:hypothetical protein